MTSDQTIAILGPPSDEDHPGGTLGDHIYSWDVPDGTVVVSCDISGVVYDKRAPKETRWERMQRVLRDYDYHTVFSRSVAVGAVALVFLLPCWLLVRWWRSLGSRHDEAFPSRREGLVGQDARKQEGLLSPWPSSPESRPSWHSWLVG
jgi:hypothetical protein